MAKVYFTEKFDEASIRKLAEAMFNEFNFGEDDKIAVKVHFGEEGNTRHVHPEEIKPILDVMKRKNYFLTDSNTLYKGSRVNDKVHMETAKKHGFDKIGKILIDGDEKEVTINKNIFKKVKVGKQTAEADSLLVISHFKGHVIFGFGGAIKNIGMGAGSRAGKLEMHSKLKPSINANCIACGKCVEHCPSDAITIVNGKAKINNDLCIGCAECISQCQSGAVNIPWSGAAASDVRKRCAEYTYGIVKGKKAVYFNFIERISEHCDCMADTPLIGKDVGIVASVDPVAIDKASNDLCFKKHGKDIFKEVTGHDGTDMLAYSEEIGLGKEDYELVRID
jgi:uncharacterized protein